MYYYDDDWTKEYFTYWDTDTSDDSVPSVTDYVVDNYNADDGDSTPAQGYYYYYSEDYYGTTFYYDNTGEYKIDSDGNQVYTYYWDSPTDANQMYSYYNSGDYYVYPTFVDDDDDVPPPVQTVTSYTDADDSTPLADY